MVATLDGAELELVPDGHGQLSHKFHHFVAATDKEKHDDHFVYRMWQDQLKVSSHNSTIAVID